jgi:rubrerythrin
MTKPPSEASACADPLRGLQRATEAIAQGLAAMAVTQQTHTEMLGAILEAATKESDGSALQEVLERIDGHLVLLFEQQTQMIAALAEFAGRIAGRVV